MSSDGPAAGLAPDATSILESITDGCIVLDTAWRFTYVNRRAAEIFAPLRDTTAPLIGQVVWDAFPPLAATRTRAVYDEAMASQEPQSFEVYYLPTGGWYRVRALPSPTALTVLFEDITRRRQAETVIAAEKKLLGLVLSDAPLGEVLDAIAREVEARSAAGLSCSLSTLDGERLSIAAAPSLPAAYTAALDGVRIGPGAGACALAAAERRTVTTRDIATDPLWRDHRALAAAHGLAACTSMPILSSNAEVLGTIALYAPAPHTPDEGDGRLIEVARDIAALAIERHRLAHVMRRGEALTHGIVEGCIDCIKTLALDGTLSWISDNGRRAMRVDDAAQLIGRRYADFWSGEYRARAEAVVTAAARGETAGFEGYLPVAGEPRWWNVVASPMLDAAGNVERLLVISRDVTERIQAAEHVRREEEQLRLLADSIPQLAWIARPDGHIFWYNQRWYEYTGTRLEEMSGWGWQSVHDPDVLPSVIERWRNAIETGETFEMEFPLRRADGEMRWFLTQVRPLRDARGEVTRWFGTNTDVDELRQVREAVQRAATEREALLDSERHARSEAERASRMKDEFLATLSHELRNPLNAILGWAQLLRRARDLDPAMVERGMEIIERNARLQAQLIEDMLDMSSIISGKLRLDVEPVDPAEVIRAALETVRPAADAKEIEVVLALEADAGPIAGDARRLQQVVWNLLSNAVKFTPRRGRVAVRLTRIGSLVELRVDDSGVGIDPLFVEHVFDRFRQADATTTKVFGGLGLGLSIVKHLTELHGGTVRAESAGADRGATFVVLLPVTGAPGETGDAAPRQATRLREPTPEPAPLDFGALAVLVVDDQIDTCEFVARVLAERGAEVRTATSAADALDLIREAPPALLVSDIGMPHMDGYALIHTVRALPAEQGGQMPAIAMTAFARDSDRERALAAGFDRHLAKPVDPADLVTMIAALTGRDPPEG